MAFKKATTENVFSRIGLIGVSGSGKTYTALNIAHHLGGPIGVIDTERGSASLYASLFDFDVLEQESGHPEKYMESIKEAERAGYRVLIIDSLSHAWMGKDGALELVEQQKIRSKSNNSYTSWRNVTPLHNRLVDTILGYKGHVICTMRAKTAYEMEQDDRGKVVPKKIGLAPIQREGLDYEFTITGEMHLENNTLVIDKTRCPDLVGKTFPKPGREFVDILKGWLQSGGPPAPAAKASPVEAPVQDRFSWPEAQQHLRQQKTLDDLRRETGAWIERAKRSEGSDVEQSVAAIKEFALGLSKKLEA